MPIVELDQEQYAQLSDGMRVTVDASSDNEVATITL
jgi:predicted aconitase with swiveling domain